jgi:hypothetical protein
MAPTPHGARGSVHRLDEANLDRLPRRSPAELTPGAFPIVARPAHPDSRAPRRPAASVPPPRAPSAIPAPRRMRDDQTEPQVMAVVDMEPAPDAQGSRVERLIDDTRRDRPGRR